jgi:hypothetical protein
MRCFVIAGLRDEAQWRCDCCIRPTLELCSRKASEERIGEKIFDSSKSCVSRVRAPSVARPLFGDERVVL